MGGPGNRHPRGLTGSSSDSTGGRETPLPAARLASSPCWRALNGRKHCTDTDLIRHPRPPHQPASPPQRRGRSVGLSDRGTLDVSHHPADHRHPARRCGRVPDQAGRHRGRSRIAVRHRLVPPTWHLRHRNAGRRDADRDQHRDVDRGSTRHRCCHLPRGVRAPTCPSVLQADHRSSGGNPERRDRLLRDRLHQPRTRGRTCSAARTVHSRCSPRASESES